MYHFSKTVAGVSKEGAGQGAVNAHPGLVRVKVQFVLEV